jgi:alpha-glucosidase
MSSRRIRWGLFVYLAATGFCVRVAEAQQSSTQPSATVPQQAEQQKAERGGRQGQQREASDRRSRRDHMGQVEVKSPDGQVSFVLLPNADRLSYAVKMGGTTVVEPSNLSLFVDGFDLAGSGLIQGDVERYEINETYPWHGSHSVAVNQCNGAKVAITSDLMLTPYTLEIRAFNDGVGYRMIVPGKEDESRLPDEYSSFVVPAGSKVWYHDLDGHYEGTYKAQDIADIKSGQWAGPPVTFVLPGNEGFATISEANLVNYAGMALECDGRRGWTIGLGHRQPINYPYELRYGREEARRLAHAAAVTGTITTPWRVVMTGRDLNALVNSDILPNLCEPADEKLFGQGMNTSWVAPGTCVWKYVDGGGPNTPENMKHFSEMAGQIGATYHILEGFAYGWSDETIRDFVDDSKRQGVRVLFWRHSRQLRTPQARDEFFARLKRLGVAGAKIDFFDHESKEDVDLYVELLKKAAEYQCVIDFHGANKPTGLLRTYPNEMIKEAVRGMEASSLQERARHETILPFTRYLAGPADYTTMVFSERRRDSTWAHQIACLAIFQSPILTIAANPQSVLDNPALDVIKSIKPVWDQTVVLPGSKIGELAIFARRSGQMWVLAVMHAGSAETIDVPLSFLGDGAYRATYVRDNLDNDAAVKLENGAARRGDTLTINLHSGGGFVGCFVK